MKFAVFPNLFLFEKKKNKRSKFHEKSKRKGRFLVMKIVLKTREKFLKFHIMKGLSAPENPVIERN